MPRTNAFRAAREIRGRRKAQTNVPASCASRYVSSGNGRRECGWSGDAVPVHVVREHGLSAAIKQFSQGSLWKQCDWQRTGRAERTAAIGVLARCVFVRGASFSSRVAAILHRHIRHHHRHAAGHGVITSHAGDRPAWCCRAQEDSERENQCRDPPCQQPNKHGMNHTSRNFSPQGSA